MYDVIEYEDLIADEDDSYILVDVRTEEEYREMTIPNSLNIPILDERERAIIGTKYVQGHVSEAKSLGLKFGGSKIDQIYNTIYDLVDDYDKIVIFCSRGGFRSSAPAALLKSLGLPIYKLNGGYKRYRQFINRELPNLISRSEFIVLYGNTGCGKTKILKELAIRQMPVVDLERLANHKGSLLGTIGEDPQPSQKMFDSLLFDSLNTGKKIFFIEGESKRIGRLFLPDSMMDKLKSSLQINIQSEINHRIKRIKDEYVHDNDAELLSTIVKLEKYIGKNKIEELMKNIQNHDYETVIRYLIVNYYDLKYASKDKKFPYTISADDEDCIDKLVNIYQIVEKAE
ncbi:MAG: tRNA 2-selenouridine(34) synthase MnmH [Tissierellia bacterium]|nr:tRNA 2-selenouridine(34) synthase MnmH [Tissierellia bacterium]